MKILIITGGSSSERKISLISAAMVRKALQKNGHKVAVFDFRKGYKALAKILSRFDLVFPVMHGKEGEDGTLYRFLKTNHKNYVGSDPNGAKVAFDKILTKKYCVKKGIKTADWKIIKNLNDIKRFGFPCVLKGAEGGSSHEVIILHSDDDLRKQTVSKLLKTNNSFFVEKLINGTEITAGILLNKALPILEIVPPTDGWFDYKNKYSGKSKEIAFAPSVPKKVQSLCQEIALKLHKELKLGSYSRTDFIVQNNTPYLLETNTPGGVGLTPQSLLPKAAQAIGMWFEELIEEMLKGRIG